MVTPDVVNEDDIAKLIISDDLPDEQPSFKAYIEAKVYDKEGHLIQYRRQPMRSLTQYFLALMAIPLIGTYQGASVNSAPGIITSVLGLPSSMSTSGNSANILWNWTIQIGSGTQGFTTSLESLAAPINNGTGAGELLYSTIGISYAGSAIYVTLQVTNATDTAVSVTEIGLQGTVIIQYYGSNGYTTTSYNFLLSYDTFSTAVSVPGYGMAVFQIILSFTG